MSTELSNSISTTTISCIVQYDGAVKESEPNGEKDYAPMSYPRSGSANGCIVFFGVR